MFSYLNNLFENETFCCSLLFSLMDWSRSLLSLLTDISRHCCCPSSWSNVASGRVSRDHKSRTFSSSSSACNEDIESQDLRVTDRTLARVPADTSYSDSEMLEAPVRSPTL